MGRWLAAGIVVAVTTAAGCAFGKKPYADDPLLDRRTRFRSGEPDRPPLEPPVLPEPAPPPPPAGPLVGGALVAVDAPAAVTSP